MDLFTKCLIAKIKENDAYEFKSYVGRHVLLFHSDDKETTFTKWTAFAPAISANDHRGGEGNSYPTIDGVFVNFDIFKVFGKSKKTMVQAKKEYSAMLSNRYW